MKDNKKVIYWFLIGCVLIFIMVVVGGIICFIYFGFFILNYKLIFGIILFMNEMEWNEVFDLYK